MSINIRIGCNFLMLLIILLLNLCFYESSLGSIESHLPGIVRQALPEVRFSDKSLRLIGTAVSSNPDQNLAIIVDRKNGKQWVLHNGGRLGRILIKEILRGKVIIDAGKGERVMKVWRFSSRGTKLASTADSKKARTKKTSAFGSRDLLYLLDREKIGAAFGDLDAILNSIKVTSGRFLNFDMGFRIVSFVPGSIFSQMGLRSGDLLLNINDKVISGPEDVRSIFETIRDSNHVNLKVRRRSRTYNINLKME